MTISDNTTLLRKADNALADLTIGGGILQPGQAAKFMQIMIRQARISTLR